MRPIAIKIDVTKINKDHLFRGEKGTYLDLVMRENKDGPGKYGDDGFVAQSVSKEAREAGEKGPIIGNWKYIGAAAPKAQDATSDIPF
jgi:hypothetical protein